ncbi:MAG: DUF5074 domain-containing protein [Muribaculaceae bacterium]|nr:DUF5074 domain-containing protein [Muribaculaceae bacterium]
MKIANSKRLPLPFICTLIVGQISAYGASPITSIELPDLKGGEIVLEAYPAVEFMYNAFPVKVEVMPEDANIRSLRLVTDLDDDPDGPIVKASYQKADKTYEFVSTPFGSLLTGNPANYTENEVREAMWKSYEELDRYKNARSCTAWFEATDGSGVTSEPFIVRVVPRERKPLADAYQEGTFWLNEEWFGHANGSINYITSSNEIKYRVYEAQNPGETFGCTSQYGMIYGGRLYVMSKQQKDNGDRYRFGGGRLVIADAATLKKITSFDEIGTNPGTGAAGPNGSTMMGDGRACVGVSPEKIYLGHHKGIRVLNIDLAKANSSDPSVAASAFTLGKEIKVADDDKGLYEGQVGNMVCTGPLVFAVSQSNGLLVIDCEKDEIVAVLGTPIGEGAKTVYAVQGVVRSADGHVWFAESGKEEGKTITRLVEVDPFSSEILSQLVLPDGAGNITTGWGAWRSTNFIASKKKNVLYWASVGSGYQDEILGASPGHIYRWEIGKDLPEEPYFSLGKRAGKDDNTFQVPYATMGYDDRTDEIVFATTHGASYNYRYEWVYRIDGTTGEIHDYQQLRPYFWFPAMPVFPDRYDPEFFGLEDLNLASEPVEINLYDHIRDLDGGENHVMFRLAGESEVRSTGRSSESPIDISLENGNLTLTPVASGERPLILQAESNGKTVTCEINVKVNLSTGITDIAQKAELNYSDGYVIAKGLSGRQLNIYNTNGQLVGSKDILKDYLRFSPDYPKGIYIIVVPGTSKTLKLKL